MSEGIHTEPEAVVLKRLEQNEIEYWKWWSDFVENGPVKFYFNEHLKGDELANHAFSEDWTNPRLVLNEISEFYRLRKSPASVFMPIGPLTGNSLQELLDSDFKLYDSMKMMALTTELPSEIRQKMKAKVIGDRDLSVWHRVYCTAFQEPPGHQIELKKRFQKMLVDPKFLFYLGEIEEIPAGSLMIYMDDKVGGIYCIGTLQEFRQKGLATVMIERSVNDARELGCDQIYLDTMANDKLEGFYNKRGFTTVGIRSIWTKP